MPGGSWGATIFQLTFRLADLATLRGVQLEFVVDSPWFVHQPFGEFLDLSLDDAEILRQTEEMCRATGDCRPYAEWREAIAGQIADDQARLR